MYGNDKYGRSTEYSATSTGLSADSTTPSTPTTPDPGLFHHNSDLDKTLKSPSDPINLPDSCSVPTPIAIHPYYNPWLQHDLFSSFGSLRIPELTPTEKNCSSMLSHQTPSAIPFFTPTNTTSLDLEYVSGHSATGFSGTQPPPGWRFYKDAADRVFLGPDMMICGVPNVPFVHSMTTGIPDLNDKGSVPSSPISSNIPMSSKPVSSCYNQPPVFASPPPTCGFHSVMNLAGPPLTTSTVIHTQPLIKPAPRPILPASTSSSSGSNTSSPVSTGTSLKLKHQASNNGSPVKGMPVIHPTLSHKKMDGSIKKAETGLISPKQNKNPVSTKPATILQRKKVTETIALLPRKSKNSRNSGTQTDICTCVGCLEAQEARLLASDSSNKPPQLTPESDDPLLHPDVSVIPDDRVQQPLAALDSHPSSCFTFSECSSAFSSPPVDLAKTTSIPSPPRRHPSADSAFFSPGSFASSNAVPTVPSNNKALSEPDSSSLGLLNDLCWAARLVDSLDQLHRLESNLEQLAVELSQRSGLPHPANGTPALANTVDRLNVYWDTEQPSPMSDMKASFFPDLDRFTGSDLNILKRIREIGENIRCLKQQIARLNKQHPPSNQSSRTSRKSRNKSGSSSTKQQPSPSVPEDKPVSSKVPALTYYSPQSCPLSLLSFCAVEQKDRKMCQDDVKSKDFPVPVSIAECKKMELLGTSPTPSPRRNTIPVISKKKRLVSGDSQQPVANKSRKRQKCIDCGSKCDTLSITNCCAVCHERPTRPPSTYSTSTAESPRPDHRLSERTSSRVSHYGDLSVHVADHDDASTETGIHRKMKVLLDKVDPDCSDYHMDQAAMSLPDTLQRAPCLSPNNDLHDLYTNSASSRNAKRKERYQSGQSDNSYHYDRAPTLSLEDTKQSRSQCSSTTLSRPNLSQNDKPHSTSHVDFLSPGHTPHQTSATGSRTSSLSAPCLDKPYTLRLSSASTTEYAGQSPLLTPSYSSSTASTIAYRQHPPFIVHSGSSCGTVEGTETRPDGVAPTLVLEETIEEGNVSPLHKINGKSSQIFRRKSDVGHPSKTSIKQEILDNPLSDKDVPDRSLDSSAVLQPNKLQYKSTSSGKSSCKTPGEDLFAVSSPRLSGHSALPGLSANDMRPPTPDIRKSDLELNDLSDGLRILMVQSTHLRAGSLYLCRPTSNSDDEDVDMDKEKAPEVPQQQMVVTPKRGAVVPDPANTFYVVRLDGDRRGQESRYFGWQVLSQAVMEVIPSSFRHLPAKARVCAYWSDQLAGNLYPGTIVEPEEDEILEPDHVAIEFDDGDRKQITLSRIRLLPDNFVNLSEMASVHLDSKAKRNARTTLDSLNSPLPRTPHHHHASLLRSLSVSVPRDSSSTGPSSVSSLIRARTNSGSPMRWSNYNQEQVFSPLHSKKARYLSGGNSMSKRGAISTQSPNRFGVCKNATPKKVGRLFKRGKQKFDKYAFHNDDDQQNASNSKEKCTKKSRNVNVSRRNSASQHGDERKKTKGFIGKKKNNEDNNCGTERSRSQSIDVNWSFRGKSIRRRSGRVYYREIVRELDQHVIKVGDSVEFSSGQAGETYLGQVREIYHDGANTDIAGDTGELDNNPADGSTMIQAAWYYYPDEAGPDGKRVAHMRHAVFSSDHLDVNEVRCVIRRAQVLPSFAEFQAWEREHAQQAGDKKKDKKQIHKHKTGLTSRRKAIIADDQDEKVTPESSDKWSVKRTDLLTDAPKISTDVFSPSIVSSDTSSSTSSSSISTPTSSDSESSSDSDDSTSDEEEMKVFFVAGKLDPKTFRVKEWDEDLVTLLDMSNKR